MYYCCVKIGQIFVTKQYKKSRFLLEILNYPFSNLKLSEKYNR